MTMILRILKQKLILQSYLIWKNDQKLFGLKSHFKNLFCIFISPFMHVGILQYWLEKTFEYRLLVKMVSLLQIMRLCRGIRTKLCLWIQEVYYIRFIYIINQKTVFPDHCYTVSAWIANSGIRYLLFLFIQLIMWTTAIPPRRSSMKMNHVQPQSKSSLTGHGVQNHVQFKYLQNFVSTRNIHSLLTDITVTKLLTRKFLKLSFDRFDRPFHMVWAILESFIMIPFISSFYSVLYSFYTAWTKLLPTKITLPFTQFFFLIIFGFEIQVMCLKMLMI